MCPTLCDTFRSRALWTWDMLARGRSVDCQIGEETLTDLTILELKIRHSSEIYSRTFSKHDEGSNGADWEWWFTGSSSKWIGFRVQAKVIDLKTNSFEHLHYRKNNSSQFQCDILIEKALQKPFPRVPLYCLYSNWNTLPNIPWSCNTYYPVQESYGCSILSAFSVHYLRSMGKSKTKHFQALIPYMNPWHCLVCCHGYGAGDLPNRVFEYWRNFILQLEESFFEEIEPNIRQELDSEINNYRQIYTQIELLDEPPSYVLLLLNNELEERPDPDLRTLTIFKERNEPM
ncbi:DUF6615 family protein [Coleofasciculus sp. FACHB-712]|uniref:DUF6615 family protein n=1 Tax=Coleofasciculus sp. FACHB-712 TaxID=2692789 RepID=UPI00321FE2B8